MSVTACERHLQSCSDAPMRTTLTENGRRATYDVALCSRASTPSFLTPLFRQLWYVITLVLLLRTVLGCELRHCILTL